MPERDSSRRKHALLMAVGSAAVLLIMAFVVSMRLRNVIMPSGLPFGGTPAFGTPADLAARMAERAGADGLPVLASAMPEFTDVSAWLNAEPITAAGLKGKVVLIDFWTYSCINCIRTMPYVTSWQRKYQDRGFTVIGVHTPEFAFEKESKNVIAAINRYGITYPVALDNDYGTWNAYSNRYWPAHYLFDAQGRLRYVHFGEGAYDETEGSIQALLAEAGQDAAMAMTEVPPMVDFARVGTPETYVGYERQEHFASPERVLRDKARQYTVPSTLRMNMFALGGTWTVEAERAVAGPDGGSIAFHYNAANANLVMGAPVAVRAEVTLDGQPVPADKRGNDVTETDGKTYVTVDEHRLYDLIRTPGEYGTHLLHIDFPEGGAECYAFTFG